MKRNMQISIRKFCKSDIEDKIRWINNPKNNEFLHYDLPLEYNKTLTWFKNNKNNDNRYDAVIEVDGITVGLIGLLNIDYKNAKAEYYITIGEEYCKGKGVASKATALLLAYAFKELELNKVYMYTEIDNIPAQKLFEKMGFRKEGYLKEDLIYNNRKVDRLFYGLTAEEYLNCSNNNSEYIFAP